MRAVAPRAGSAGIALSRPTIAEPLHDPFNDRFRLRLRNCHSPAPAGASVVVGREPKLTHGADDDGSVDAALPRHALDRQRTGARQSKARHLSRHGLGRSPAP
jgi:hypothetical protein